MRRKHTILAIFSMLVSCSLLERVAFPQTSVIAVGPNVQVSGARGSSPHGEVFVAANPMNPRALVGTSMIFPEGQNKTSTIVYASSDGGKTWKPTLEGDRFIRSDDPAVAYGPHGALFYVVAATAADTHHYLALYRSIDDGKTWNDPALIPDDFEHAHREVVVADNTDGKNHGRVYVVGTGVARSLDGSGDQEDLAVFYSTDGGASFLGPIKRILTGAGGLAGHVTCSVLSDGTLICLIGQLKASSNEVVPTEGSTNAWLKVVMSKDGGQSLSPSITVSDYAMDQSGWANHAPMLAVDRGSRWFKDRLYAVWPDRRSGRVEILLSKSEDEGETWSLPHVVNDDQPFAKPSHGPDDFMPAIAVNNDGVVGVVWCDRRDNTDDLGWWIRFTASLDGGSTFLPSVRVSEAANLYGRDKWNVIATTSRQDNNPDKLHGAFQVSVAVHPFHFVGGDYGGMAADAAGVFHPFWVDNRTGVPQVWTSAVVVNGAGIRHGSPDLADLRDTSKNFRLELSGVSYDKIKDLVTLNAQLRNTSQTALIGPFKVRVLSLQSELGNVNIVNADNSQQTAGAVWDFTSLVNGNALGPDEATRNKTLVFRVTNIRPLREGDITHFGLVNFEAQVLGRISK